MKIYMEKHSNRRPDFWRVSVIKSNVMQQKASQPSKAKLLHENENKEPDFSDLDTGWAWVVLIASFGTSCLMGATQFASGIIHVILLDRYRASVSMTTVVGALHTAFTALGGPLSSMVLDRFSCRTAIVMSGFFFVIGCIATAFAPNIEVVIITRGVIAGFGGALGFTANMVVVGFYFKKRRNLALSLSNAGVGVGMFVLSPLMQLIYDHYGFFGFFLILAGIFGQIIVFGMLSFPSKLERHAKAQQNKTHLARNENHDCCGGYKEVLKNKAVLCLSVGMLSYGIGTFLLFLHLPNYIVAQGFSPDVAAKFVSLSGILTVGGRILTGVLSTCQCSRDTILYWVPMFFVSVTTVIYPFISKSYGGNLTYVIFLGLFYGNSYVLTTGVTLKYVGITHVSKAIGIQYLLCGIGALLGPVFAGILVDVGGSYAQAFYFAGVCTMISGIVSGAAACFPTLNDTLITAVFMLLVSLLYMSNIRKIRI